MMKRAAMLAAMVLLVFVAARLTSPVVGAAEKGDAKAGFEVYKKNCLKCHGEQGKGDGPAGRLLKVKPADWTDKARMSKLTDNDLVAVTSKGGTAVGKSVAMPGFGDKLKSQEINNVVAYVLQVAGR